MNEQNEICILKMAMGAIEEKVNYEMAKVMGNILDVNTSSVEKRTLTVKLTFSPDDERQTIGVKAEAKTKLAATNAVSTQLYITNHPDTGEAIAVEMVPNIPGQADMFGKTQEEPKILKLFA